MMKKHFNLSLLCFKQSLYLHKLIFFSLLSLYLNGIAYSQGTDWGDNITVTQSSCTQSQSPNCRKFTFSNIPVNTQVATTYGYFYFISFGDGKYRRGTIGADTTFLSVEHDYLWEGAGEIYAEFAKQYDEDDKPVKIIVGDLNGSENGTFPGGTDTIFLFNSLKPRGGDTMSYVISYRNPCTDENLNGIISFDFEADKVQIHEVHTFGRESVTISNSIGNLTISTSALPIDNYRNIILELAIRQNVEENDSLTFITNFIPDSNKGEGPAPSCLTSTVSDTSVLMAVKSHDPNLMLANKSFICLEKVDSITYTIIFQNIGTGPADTVKVVSVLPDCFLLEEAKIKMKKPDGFMPEIDIPRRELTWYLTKGNRMLKDDSFNFELKGLNQLDYINNMREDATIDSIIFTVFFDTDYKLTPCGAIVSVAEITFDYNASMFTNECFIEIRCDRDCNPCDGDIFVEKLPLIIWDGRNPVPLKIPYIGNGYTCTWYPSCGLDDSHSSQPLASPKSDCVYTVVASKGCERRVMQVPVYLAKRHCCYWYCLLLLIIPLLLIFILRKRNRNS